MKDGKNYQTQKKSQTETKNKIKDRKGVIIP